MPFFLRILFCSWVLCIQHTGMYAQEEGIASYYHARFHGRKTASGKVYDKEAMVAAHRFLPFGTFVKVTNLTNGKRAVVMIQDRGPFRRGWIIDVSGAAAEKLDFVTRGIAKVRLEIVPGPQDYADLPFLSPQPFRLDTEAVAPEFPANFPSRHLPAPKKKYRHFPLVNRKK